MESVGASFSWMASKTITSAFSGPTAAILGVTAAVGGGLAIWNAYKQSMEEARQATEDAAEEWGESNDSLDTYKTRIEELRTSIDSGTLSEEESYEAKEELLSIQQSLIDTFGAEAEGIDLVNGAYEEQIGLIETLSSKNADEFLNDNVEQIDKATKKIEGFSSSLGMFVAGSDEEAAIDSIISKYSDYFSKQYSDNGLIELRFNANAEDAEEVLTEFKSDILDFRDYTENDSFLSAFYNNANSAIDSASKILDKWQEIYDQAKEAEIIADDTPYTYQGTSQTASKWLSDYSKAVEAYNEALASGDEEAIATAKEDYEFLNTALNGFSTTLSRWTYDDAVAEISGEFDEAAAAASDFKQELSDDAITDATGEIHTGLVETIKEAELSEESLTSIFDSMSNLGGDEAKSNPLLDGMDEEVSNALILIQGLAEDAGVSVEDLIAAFVELGIVASDVSTSVDDTTTFSSLFLDSEGEATEFSESIDTFQDEISDINDALDSLRTGEDVDFTDLVQEFPELAGQADNLEEALTNLSAAKLEEFAQTWQESISTISDPDQIAAANEMFADLLKNMDLSEYIDATSAEKIYNHLFSVIANGRMGNGNARALVDQLMAEFGDSNAVLEAIVKLSANPDAANWTYEEWVAQIEDQAVDINLRISEDTVESLQTDLEALESEADVLESEISLNESKGIKTTADDYKKLIKNSQKQIDNLEDTNDELENQRDLLKAAGKDYSEIESQINDNIVAINSAKQEQIEWNETALNLDYTQAEEAIENLQTAISESASSTGLSTESIQNIIDMYSGLDGYDPTVLFEKTENGIHLNTEALNALEDQYESVKRADLQSDLEDLQQEYAETTAEVKRLTEENGNLTDAQLEAMLAANDMRTADAISEDIINTERLISQYDGLTSAYNKYIQATSATDERSSFETLANAYEDIGDLIANGWGGDSEVQSYLDVLLSDAERTGDAYADYQKLGEKIEGTNHALADYFTFNSETGDLTAAGLESFLQDVDTIFDDYVDHDEETGLYNFDFSGYRLEEIADRFGTTTEFIQLMERAMIDAGFAIDIGTEYLTDYEAAASKTNTTLQELAENSEIDIDVDLDYDASSMTPDELKDKIAELEEAKATIDVSTEEGQTAVDALDAEIDALRNQEVYLSIYETTSSDNGYTLDELYEMVQNGDTEQLTIALGLENEAEVTTAIDQITSLYQSEQIELKVSTVLEDGEQSADELLGLGDEELVAAVGVEVDENEVASVAEKIRSEIETQTSEADTSLTVKIDESQFDILTGETDVEIGGNTEALDTTVAGAKEEIESSSAAKLPIDGDVSKLKSTVAKARQELLQYETKIPIDANVEQLKSTINQALSGTRTISVQADVVGTANTVATGTAHASGTARDMWVDYSHSIGAFADGTTQDWALPHNENALVNEVGTESIVRDGKWMMIPGGAHIQSLKKNDIIFNAQQTAELIKYGKVMSGGGHGQVALANGTAYNMINAYSNYQDNGGGNFHITATSVTKTNNSDSSSTVNVDTSTDTSESKEEFEELFDWIEVAISRIERKISNLDTKANRTYKSWSARNKNLQKEINQISKEIDTQQAGYDRYIKQANSVMSDAVSDGTLTKKQANSYKKKVQNGTIDIESIKNEDVYDAVTAYQEWWNYFVPLNLFNCGNIPITLSRYNGTGNGKCECGIRLKRQRP